MKMIFILNLDYILTNWVSGNTRRMMYSAARRYLGGILICMFAEEMNDFSFFVSFLYAFIEM